MDPFNFAILSVGSAGASLLLVSFLESRGFTINQTAVNIILEISKYGAILYLLKKVTVFL